MEQEQTKFFLLSKTLWGAAAAFVGVILPLFGLNVEPADLNRLAESWVQVLDTVLTFGGLALTVYARLREQKPKKLTFTFRR